MMDRRALLRGLGAFGCSAAAHPFLTTVTLAGTASGKGLGDQRLVVIILRGAMDGLDVVRPLGDKDFATYRPTLGKAEHLELDGFFGMHVGLSGLHPLWAAGELAFVHATSTPYRDKRSHFDGQDLLEAGTGPDLPISQVRDGWLNRLLQSVPGLKAETAFAVGRQEMRVLRGPAPVLEWAPDTAVDLSPQAQLLLEQVYHDDALFQSAAAEALLLGGAEDMDMAAEMDPAKAMRQAKRGEAGRVAAYAAEKLRQETRIAAFSLTGWDTHKAQGKRLGQSLRQLEQVILRLKADLGPEIWGKTTVLAMTEFGRTVAENGTGGTDHGTAGAMLAAGGAIRGGKVYGQWPGLSEAALFDRRDLMPTSDVRTWAAHAMRGLYGFDRTLLQSKVFPGLEMGDDPGLIL
ncbi:DUF1501 domain-containing protein [Tabrizicola oligotrophica]|uniref:DUF1501 domain-containing protein n=1 Tax=Tabrizicola oligotrophica TaxID=2710650 RepID=A0A6M0QVD4_9RHOB|nr:DUF1501 domain-containing protein [Tabrizicola oligotrophica]NEY90422.1 DUF1501 domain-containing protein [Tabrizicola oligotrophica]